MYRIKLGPTSYTILATKTSPKKTYYSNVGFYYDQDKSNGSNVWVVDPNKATTFDLDTVTEIATNWRTRRAVINMYDCSNCLIEEV